MTNLPEPLLSVEELSTEFATRGGTLKAVTDLSFSLRAGRTMCIVGESGSGKSVTALSIMGLIERPGRITSGRILYRGRDLLTLPEAEMERIRGNRIGMVFQNPMTSLNPSFRLGDQIAEAISAHQDIDEGALRARAIELLTLVGIPDAAHRYDDYPHQFSGGMRQRVLIAGAIACNPDIIIADEPTTALDVTIQAQILRLLRDLQRRLNSALLLITHDLGVVAAMADDVMVMYAGRAVEYGDVGTIFHEPKHPYTRSLLSSLVRLEDTRDTPLSPIPGSPISALNLPAGCAFKSRCSHAMDRCASATPPPVEVGPGHVSSCYLHQPGA